jgi:arabinose-5-phosphate isomerase
VRADALAADAADVMERTASPACWWWTSRAVLVGALNSNDLMRAKVI